METLLTLHPHIHISHTNPSSTLHHVCCEKTPFLSLSLSAYMSVSY